MSSESVIEVPRRTVRTSAGEVTFGPLTVRQIPPFTRALRPAFGALAGVLTSPEAQDAGEPAGPEVNLEALLGLVAEHGEALAEAVAIATGAPREHVDGLHVDEFLELAVAVFAVNADFFVRAAAASRTAAASLGGGPTPSRS